MLKYNAKITNIIDITKNIKEFTVEGEELLNYEAGQFCMLGLIGKDGNHIIRSYSISSAPSAGIRKFYIILKENGSLTPMLFNLKTGDEIFCSSRAVGHLTLNEIQSDNILFLATGTGVSPFKSIIESEKFTDKKITLIHGVRFVNELGYKEYFENIKNPNFKYIACITREDSKYVNGRITKAFDDGLIDDFLSNKEGVCLMCGSTEMITSCEEKLLLSKIKKENIIKEGY